MVVIALVKNSLRKDNHLQQQQDQKVTVRLIQNELGCMVWDLDSIIS